MIKKVGFLQRKLLLSQGGGGVRGVEGVKGVLVPRGARLVIGVCLRCGDRCGDRSSLFRNR